MDYSSINKAMQCNNNKNKTYLAHKRSLRCGARTGLSHNNFKASKALFLLSIGSAIGTHEDDCAVVPGVVGAPLLPLTDPLRLLTPIRLSSSPDAGSNVSGGQPKVGIESESPRPDAGCAFEEEPSPDKPRSKISPETEYYKYRLLTV